MGRGRGGFRRRQDPNAGARTPVSGFRLPRDISTVPTYQIFRNFSSASDVVGLGWVGRRKRIVALLIETYSDAEDMAAAGLHWAGTALQARAHLKRIEAKGPARHPWSEWQCLGKLAHGKWYGHVESHLLHN
jgi:hypothetical protein